MNIKALEGPWLYNSVLLGASNSELKLQICNMCRTFEPLQRLMISFRPALSSLPAASS